MTITPNIVSVYRESGGIYRNVRMGYIAQQKDSTGTLVWRIGNTVLEAISELLISLSRVETQLAELKRVNECNL